MQRGKKQTTALGLFILVALPLLLPLGALIKQKILQFQRRERFETEQLQTITIKADKIYWIKPGKEVLIAGELFDVEDFKSSGTDITLSGFYDQQEDKLVKDIKELEKGKPNSNSPVNHFAVKFLFSPKYQEPTGLLIQNNWQLVTRQFPVYTETVFSMAYPTASPPPKAC